MKLYTVEIGHRAVAAFNAQSWSEAEQFSRTVSFLKALSIRGDWNGFSDVATREASVDECAVWQASRSEALAMEDGRQVDELDERDKAMWLVFLQPVGHLNI